jgi:hypothetical protein
MRFHNDSEFAERKIRIDQPLQNHCEQGHPDEALIIAFNHEMSWPIEIDA